MTRPRTTKLGMERLDDRLTPALVVPNIVHNPAGQVTLLLDFDGGTVNEWGDFEPGRVPAFDIDGNPSDFSFAEYLEMSKIVSYVAEDFAPFDVKVTTIDQGSPGTGEGVRLYFGGMWSDWLGEPASGVAYRSDFREDGRPKVFVFTANIYAGRADDQRAKDAADTASHEAGHALGLHHQSRYGGLSSAGNTWRIQEYSTGEADVAPLMGDSGGKRSVWWAGSRDSGAVTHRPAFQDDLAVLGGRNGPGHRADDHAVTDLGAFADRRHLRARGVVERLTDTDTFTFTHPGGRLDLDLQVWNERNASLPLAANLDAKVTIEAEATNGRVLLVRLDPSDRLGAGILLDLARAGNSYGSYGRWTGRYLVTVASKGNRGDVGQYTLTLTGTVLPQVVTTTVVPTVTAVTAAARAEPPTRRPTPVAESAVAVTPAAKVDGPSAGAGRSVSARVPDVELLGVWLGAE